jgi:hypothetical protein
MTRNDNSNESFPSDLKVTRRGGEITMKFRTATVVTTPEGALAIAEALKEVALAVPAVP